LCWQPATLNCYPTATRPFRTNQLEACSFLLDLSFGCLCGAACRAEPASGRFLAYKTGPAVSDASRSLKVAVSFRLPASKLAQLVLPSAWQGQQEMYKAIGDLEPLSPGDLCAGGRNAVVKRGNGSFETGGEAALPSHKGLGRQDRFVVLFQGDARSVLFPSVGAQFSRLSSSAGRRGTADVS